MKVFRGILVLAGLGLAALAGWLGAEEYRGFYQLSALPADLYAYASLDPAQFRFAATHSIAGDQAQMAFCINRQNSYLYLRAGEERSLALTRACLARAEDILAYSPSRSLAHLERADALWRLGRAEEAAVALEAARATGPNEGWMAVVRVRMALNLAGGEGPDLRARMLGLAADDLAVLVTAPNLTDRVVALYLGAPDFRDRFVLVMEAQPEAAQRRFLAALRRARNAGAGHE